MQSVPSPALLTRTIGTPWAEESIPQSKYICKYMRDDRVIKLPVFRTMVSPVARKAWKCNLCKTNVDIGSRYVHYIDRRAHEIISYRFHKECFAMVETYCAVRHRPTFTPRSVQNWANKTFCERCPKKDEGCKLNPCKRILTAIKYTPKKDED